jgi:uncharacterized protein (TIGR00369 family)
MSQTHSSTTPDHPPESRLAQWLAAEAAQRVRYANRPPAPREQMQGLDGLSQLQHMLLGHGTGATLALTLDFMLIEVAYGRAVFQVHGGWYASMLDSALGCSVHAALPAGRGYTTLEFKVNLVRALKPQMPATPEPQRVRAEGQIVHLGRQTATAQARLVGPDDKLYAHATTTCLVFDLAARAA